MKTGSVFWGCVFAISLAACDAAAVGSSTPTVEVQRSETFVRQVVADGFLEASSAAAITAPPEAKMPMTIAWIAEEGAPINKGDVVLRFDPSEAERKLADSLADLESAKLSMRKEKESGGSALTKRDQAAVQAAREIEAARDFQIVDEDAFARHELVNASIDVELAEAKAEHAKAVKRVERAASQSRAELIGITQAQAQREVDQARETLTRLEVKAENAGILVLSRDWKGQTKGVGDNVWPGQKIGELPMVSDMQVSLYILEADAAELEAGVRAEVVIDAYPNRVYPAKIKTMDALAQPRHHEVPVQYFQAVLEFEETDTQRMKVGSRVRTTLFVEKEAVIDLPRQAVFEEEGKFFVYRQDGQGFSRAEVELGSSSAGRVVITKGIEEGDKVALRDPKGKVGRFSGGHEAKGETD